MVDFELTDEQKASTSGLTSMPGTSGPIVRARRASYRRSEFRASPAPGYCTLTATSRPSRPATTVHLADAGRGGRAAVEPDQVVLPAGSEVELDLRPRTV